MCHYRTIVLTQILRCTPFLLTRRPIPPFRESTDIRVRIDVFIPTVLSSKCEYLKKVFNFSESHFIYLKMWSDYMFMLFCGLNAFIIVVCPFLDIVITYVFFFFHICSVIY